MDKMRRAPGPRGNLFLGSLREFRRNMFEMLDDAHERYGDIVRLRLAHTSTHIVFHPALAEEALIKNREQIVKYSLVRPQTGLALLLGNGLLMNNGESWRRQRDLINPLFSPKVLDSLVDDIVQCSDVMLERLDQFSARREAVDIVDQAQLIALEVAMATMFGTRDTREVHMLRQAIEFALPYCYDSAKNPLMPPLSWPTPRNLRFRQVLKFIDTYVANIIEQRLLSGEKKRDLLGLLLEATYSDSGERISAKQLRDESVTMLGAGHETTGGALAWALLELEQRPDIVARIRLELDEVIGETKISATHLRRLEYLQAVVQEVLRLNPPTPLILRAVRSPVKIAGYDIPPGTMFFTSVRHIHRRPDIWPNPIVLDPTRFLKSSDAHRPRCSYLPFGAGERFCIGSNFALMELTILLAQLIRRFDFSLLSSRPVRSVVAVTHKPVSPLPMRVTRVARKTPLLADALNS